MLQEGSSSKLREETKARNDAKKVWSRRASILCGVLIVEAGILFVVKNALHQDVSSNSSWRDDQRSIELLLRRSICDPVNDLGPGQPAPILEGLDLQGEPIALGLDSKQESGDKSRSGAVLFTGAGEG